MRNLIPYKTDSGCLISLVDFFPMSDNRIVFTGTLLEVPGNKTRIDSDDLRKLLKGQLLFGRPIIGTELFAIYTQSVPASVGLLVDFKLK